MISNSNSPSMMMPGSATNNRLLMSGGGGSSNITPLKQTTSPYNVSPISPMMAQSSPHMFKNMIDKNLFASIQKGFDEYEGTKAQRADVHERVNKQEENEPLTIRARQAYVANTFAVNEDIRLKRLAQQDKVHWERMPSGLSPGEAINRDKPPYKLLNNRNQSARTTRLSMRDELSKESRELSNFVNNIYEETAVAAIYENDKYGDGINEYRPSYVDSNKMNTNYNHRNFSINDISNISNVTPSSWNDFDDNMIQNLEDKLIKVLMRKQATIAKATRSLEKIGILKKKTHNNKKVTVKRRKINRKKNVIGGKGNKKKKKFRKKKKKVLMDFTDLQFDIDEIDNNIDENTGRFKGISTYGTGISDGTSSSSSRRKIKTMKKSLRIKPVKKSLKIPKSKSKRIKLVLSLLTEKPAKMSKGTKKRLYNKKAVKAKKKEALERRAEMAKPKLHRDAFSKLF